METSAAAADALVTIDRSHPGAPVTSRVLGANEGVWEDLTQPSHVVALRKLGVTGLRWPGGSTSNQYHWRQNTACPGGYPNPASTFDAFVEKVTRPLDADLSITLNYGSNEACDGGGDPNEAAAWVSAAKQRGVAVRRWTIGNETYGEWETDLHGRKYDAATYAQAVADGFYPAIKAADPQAKIGVVVEPDYKPGWDPIVLKRARYDFVELHFYAQINGHEDDARLLSDGPPALARALDKVKRQLREAGRADAPIYVGEINSVNANPGKQSMGIVEALFAGQALGELMKSGVDGAAWWSAFGSCTEAPTGNFSDKLAGWQSFGGYMLAADEALVKNCPPAAKMPAGALTPAGQAFRLMSFLIRDGERLLPVSLSGEPGLRAYAATHGAGEAVALFNLDPSRAIHAEIAVTGQPNMAGAALDAYDRARYDETQQNRWLDASSTTLPAAPLPLAVTLAPWSMTLVRIEAAKP